VLPWDSTLGNRSSGTFVKSLLAFAGVTEEISTVGDLRIGSSAQYTQSCTSASSNLSGILLCLVADYLERYQLFHIGPFDRRAEAAEQLD
jgi:hypothetical protein